MPPDPASLLDRSADADDDPLSQVVALLRPRTALSASLEAGGAWCLRFPASPTTIKFLAVESGGCWMRREGEPECRAAAGSGFAARFKSLVGLPPLDYLMRLRLRMLQAARALREGGSTVATVAGSLGYDSDSAFSHAFKRVMGSSPSAWRGRNL